MANYEQVCDLITDAHRTLRRMRSATLFFRKERSYHCLDEANHLAQAIGLLTADFVQRTDSVGASYDSLKEIFTKARRRYFFFPQTTRTHQYTWRRNKKDTFGVNAINYAQRLVHNYENNAIFSLNGTPLHTATMPQDLEAYKVIYSPLSTDITFAYISAILLERLTGFSIPVYPLATSTSATRAIIDPQTPFEDKHFIFVDGGRNGYSGGTRRAVSYALERHRQVKDSAI